MSLVSFNSGIGFTPANLSLTGYWRANFTGLPWVGTASIGTSSGRNLVTQADDPSTGASQNGFAPADFNGSSNYIQADVNNTTLLGTSGSIFFLFNGDTAPTNSGLDYGDGNIFTDPTNAETTFGFTDLGFGACILDDSITYRRISISCGTGNYHLAQAKWNGTNLYARIDSGNWSNIASGPFTAITPSAPNVGLSYSTIRFDGRLLELGITNIFLSDSDFNNIVSYVNKRYHLSL